MKKNCFWLEVWSKLKCAMSVNNFKIDKHTQGNSEKLPKNSVRQSRKIDTSFFLLKVFYIYSVTFRTASKVVSFMRKLY